jgi:hypothetical protein
MHSQVSYGSRQMALQVKGCQWWCSWGFMLAAAALLPGLLQSLVTHTGIVHVQGMPRSCIWSQGDVDTILCTS